jgi:plasmid stabilization system protein ParE
MIVEFEAAARADFDEAFSWYAERSIAAAERFVDEVDEAIRKISSDPKRFPRSYGGCQRCQLQRFPFSVIYLYDSERVKVIAIAHTKRRPTYWRRRL